MRTPVRYGGMAAPAPESSISDALLQAWDVAPASWTRWAGPIHERNPELDPVERAGRAATEYPEA